MRLIRFDDNKTGLVVELASGAHVVDVIASVGALVPEDPISHGILNGLLKADNSWAQLLEHWEMTRKGLRRLAVLARAPGPTRVVVCRLDEVARPPNGIASLDVLELEAASQDPTGRAVMERQFDPTTRPASSQYHRTDLSKSDHDHIWLRCWSHSYAKT
jgi:hypothetical protein